MANNTISQVEINGETYDLLDNNILNRIYPIGSIYMSVDSTSPASFIGGTWEQIQDTFLLAAGSNYTAGSTGGEATHTLLTAELPSHAHTIPAHGHSFTQPTVNGGAITNGITGGSHKHSINYVGNGSTGGGAWMLTTNGTNSNGSLEQAATHTHSLPAHTHTVSGGKVSDKAAFATEIKGSGSAHNNMPPYLAVYMWKRTA